jgi:hypothetical protein
VQFLKVRIEPLLEEGIELFKGGHFEAALSKFQAAQSIYPQDLPLQRFVTSVRGALDSGKMMEGTALLDFR